MNFKVDPDLHLAFAATGTAPPRVAHAHAAHARRRSVARICATASPDQGVQWA